MTNNKTITNKDKKDVFEKLSEKIISITNYVKTLEDFLNTIDNERKIKLENQIKATLTSDDIFNRTKKQDENNEGLDRDVYKKIINRQDFLNLFQFLAWFLLTYDMMISFTSHDDVLQFFYGNYTQKSFSDPQTDREVFLLFCKFIETNKALFSTEASKIAENDKNLLFKSHLKLVENKNVAIWDERVMINNHDLFFINTVLTVGYDHFITMMLSNLIKAEKKLTEQDMDDAIAYSCLFNSLDNNKLQPMLKSFVLFPCVFSSMSGILNVLFRYFSSPNSYIKINEIISNACNLSYEPSNKSFFVGGFFPGIATFGLLGAGFSYKLGLMSMLLCNLTVFGGILLCAGFLCGVIAYEIHCNKCMQNTSQVSMCSMFLQKSLVNIQNFSKGNDVDCVVDKLVNFANKGTST